MLRVHRVTFKSFFSAVNNENLLISATRRRLKPGVTSTFDSSTTVLCQCSMHITFQVFQNYTVFAIIRYGGMSISTPRGRLKPEVMSPVNEATLVSLSCSINIIKPYRIIPKLSAVFCSENNRMTLSIDSGRARPELRRPVQE
jgi:hypothetical protein